MSENTKFRYRSEIDGLRAIAVLAVVLFHAGFGFSGGFVGVDVFFVISGFLITSLIWKDLEAGRFSFVNFWERRARRIAPALLVVTVITLAVGWFLLLPADYANLGRVAAAQALFAANIHYWRDSGYFAGVSEEKPLLHTWSLAVEEQFYLFVPFLLWGMYRFRMLRTRTAVFAVLAVACAVSFALSIYGVPRYSAATFYLLPTRAWELLFGSLIAFMPAAPAILGRKFVREIISLVALALILVPVFIYNKDTPFPGLAALYPCLGAALIIWSNSGERTIVGDLLSLRPLVFVGLISYSLYLWHWPLLAYSKYFALAPLTPLNRAVLMALGFVFAILSWKYIETPFRTRKLGASRKAMFTYAGVGLVVVFGLGAISTLKHGFPQRFPEQAQLYADAKFDRTFLNEMILSDIKAGKFVSIGAKDSDLRPTILVWGDSHAMAAVPAFDSLLKEKGLVGRVATHSATAPVLNDFYAPKYGLDKDTVAYNKTVFSYIQSQKIPVVVLIANWSYYRENDAHNSQPLNPSLLTTVRELVKIGCRPWVMLDVPAQSFDVPKALCRSVIYNTDITSLCARPTSENELSVGDPGIISDLKAAGASILDPKPAFLDPKGQYYVVEMNKTPLYCDATHLTTKGAKIKLLPVLRESFSVFGQ
jgi:peptidoglycan/LPS O-acetylase OafA/YrhL